MDHVSCNITYISLNPVQQQKNIDRRVDFHFWKYGAMFPKSRILSFSPISLQFNITLWFFVTFGILNESICTIHHQDDAVNNSFALSMKIANIRFISILDMNTIVWNLQDGKVILDLVLVNLQTTNLRMVRTIRL